MILGFALRALLAAAVVAAAVSLVIYVSGKITRSKLREKLQENGIKDVIVKAVDRCNNVVSVEELDSDKTVEIRGDDVSYDLFEGDLIFV